MTTDEIPELALETKRQIITNKLQLWSNTLYDAELDVKTGKRVGNVALVKQGERKVKEAIGAIEFLMKELEALNKIGEKQVEAAPPEA